MERRREEGRGKEREERKRGEIRFLHVNVFLPFLVLKCVPELSNQN